MNGIDISQHNEGLSLKEIKDSIDFVIVRGSFTGWGTGVNYNKDTMCEKFYKEAKDNNIPIGCYHYSCANTKEKGIAEANFLYENFLKGKQFEYPIYIDVEDEHHQIKDKNGTTEAIIGFCETLEDKGFYVGVYANNDWFCNHIDTNRLKDYDKWLAWWYLKDKPNFKYGAYQVWQNSDKGKVGKYSLDTDVCYVNYPDIIKNAGLNGYGNISYKKGDSGSDIEKIDTFLANKVKGNYFGDYTEGCVNTFKRLHNLEENGIIDNETLELMKKEGLEL